MRYPHLPGKRLISKYCLLLFHLAPPRDMGVSLGELIQFGFQVEVFVLELESTQILDNISFNIRNTFNLGQIASDRGGTTISNHRRQLERDELNAFRQLCRLTGSHRLGLNRSTLLGATDKRCREQCCCNETMHDSILHREQRPVTIPVSYTHLTLPTILRV